MITKHEDADGNEYFSKLINPETFLVMDADGDMYNVPLKEWERYSKKRNLRVIGFTNE